MKERDEVDFEELSSQKTQLGFKNDGERVGLLATFEDVAQRSTKNV